jgi:hypothetical protein
MPKRLTDEQKFGLIKDYQNEVPLEVIKERYGIKSEGHIAQIVRRAGFSRNRKGKPPSSKKGF